MVPPGRSALSASSSDAPRSHGPTWSKLTALPFDAPCTLTAGPWANHIDRMSFVSGATVGAPGIVAACRLPILPPPAGLPALSGNPTTAFVPPPSLPAAAAAAFVSATVHWTEHWKVRLASLNAAPERPRPSHVGPWSCAEGLAVAWRSILAASNGSDKNNNSKPTVAAVVAGATAAAGRTMFLHYFEAFLMFLVDAMETAGLSGGQILTPAELAAMMQEHPCLAGVPALSGTQRHSHLGSSSSSAAAKHHHGGAPRGGSPATSETVWAAAATTIPLPPFPWVADPPTTPAAAPLMAVPPALPPAVGVDIAMNACVGVAVPTEDRLLRFLAVRVVVHLMPVEVVLRALALVPQVVALAQHAGVHGSDPALRLVPEPPSPDVIVRRSCGALLARALAASQPLWTPVEQYCKVLLTV